MDMINKPISLAGSILSAEQQALTQNLIQTLTQEQIQWLAGYMTGLHAANQNLMQLIGAMPQIEQDIKIASAPEITIFYGTRTGNSQFVAEIAEQIAIAKGLKPVLKDMISYKPKNLKKESNVLIIVSTDGEGEAPFAAKELHEFLEGNRAPKLNNLNYAVLGLGDKSYQFFCQTGKDFDLFLEKTGACKIHDRADLDLDFEDPAEEWLNIVMDKFADKLNTQPRTQASVIASVQKSKYNKKNPFHATILEKINLNGKGSDKETYHIELSLEDSGLEYEPGDALGIYAKNSEKSVDELIAIGKFDPTASVIINNEEFEFRNALLDHLEITVLNKEVIEKYNNIANNSELKAILEDSDKLKDLLWGNDVADLLLKFPAEIAEKTLVEILHKIPPRLYSISSSLQANEDEVHLTIGAVRYSTNGRNKEGVASTFFADRLEAGDTIQVYVDKNRGFKLPQDETKPIIMVGPGTGIAPFRAFLQEREERESSGKNWLFFGDQHFSTDFLYQTEWQQYLKENKLTKLDVAFSRDQDNKIYVQDRMLENSKELYQWLEEGAYFYVCGDKNRMAKDVHKTLKLIIEKEGNRTPEEAEEYITNLLRTRRYQEDVY